MPTKIVPDTPKFMIFDRQKLTETQHLIFGADYVLIRPNIAGCTLLLNNNSYRLNTDQLVLLAPFSPFRLSLGSNHFGQNQEIDCDILYFRLNSFGLTFVSNQQFADIRALLDQAKFAPLFEGDRTADIGEVLDRLENTFDFCQVINFLTILEKLSKLEIKQCLLESVAQSSYSKKTEGKLKTSLQYIQEHLTEPLTVAMVANQVYMAESTFSRFFNANMGVTFWQYVIEQRVRKATHLLIETDNSISYISAEVGFTSISSFNAKFKELLQMTPKQYRKSHIDMRADWGGAVAQSCGDGIG